MTVEELQNNNNSNEHKIVLVGEEDTSEYVEVFTIDVHHFFAVTFSKGKKNDHAMHNVALDNLFEYYREAFRWLSCLINFL